MLNVLYSAIAKVVLAIHSALSPVFGANTGAAWALSIVLLTVAMRLLLFPLFVKQIRAQRAMQALQPKVKELREKHKGDKEAQQREMMALYKEHGANPVAGCLPLVLQMPVFFALFRVLDHIKPGASPKYGFTADQIHSAAVAKVFGAPIAASFNSSADTLRGLAASALNVQVLAAVLIVLMGASTFMTQRQLLSRTGPVDPMQAKTQKIMLYVLPFTFVIFGYRFPIGVLLYWLTTNVWSMGQQYFVIKRMPVAAGGQVGARPAPAGKSGLFTRLISAAQAQQETKAGGSAAAKQAAGKPPKQPKQAAGKQAKEARTRSQSGQTPSTPPAAAAAPPSTPTTGTAASGTPPNRLAKPAKPAVAAVGVRRPHNSRAKRKGRRGGRR